MNVRVNSLFGVELRLVEPSDRRHHQRVQGSSPWRCTNQSPVRIPRTGLCCIPHKVGGSGLQPVADEFEVVYREGVDAVQLPLLELTVNCW